jgi:hypothetical protein
MSFPFMDVCDVRQEVFPVRQNHSIGLIANSAWPCVHCESGIRASVGDLCEEQPTCGANDSISANLESVVYLSRVYEESRTFSKFSSRQ